MKKVQIILAVLVFLMMSLTAVVFAAESPITPCLNCHDTVSPGVVKQEKQGFVSDSVVRVNIH